MESKKITSVPSLTYTGNKEYGKVPNKPNPLLQCLGTPHIESFDFMIKDGLDAAIRDLIPVAFELPGGDRIKLHIEAATFVSPAVPLETVGVRNTKVLPTECRQRASTYKGEFKIRLTITINGKSVTMDKSLGSLPIMLKSKLCHLADMSPKQLVEANEHADEWGGYFVVKGNERIVRMLLVSRRNYPISIKRPSWKLRGNLFSEYGVLIRCIREDQSSVNNVLHFINNGTAKLMFIHRRVLYYAPLILIMKCLADVKDHYIFRLLINGRKKDLYYVSCIQNMLRELHMEGLHTSKECKNYLGKMFRIKFYELPTWETDEAVADFILDRVILNHLKTHRDKFNLLVFMTQKLFDVVQNKCKVEGADTVMVQELLLGGHLYLQVLKERVQNYLFTVKANLMKKAKTSDKLTLSKKDMESAIKMSGNLEQRMETFISTGNAPSNDVNLHQYKGLTIMAENINRLRYMSHFKSIHRGAFFMEMRTTEARQLQPDAWGFVCPVHTPDGTPCGLLNHLTMACQVTPTPAQEKVARIPGLLANLGMDSISSVANFESAEDVYKYPVLLDGRMIGFMPTDVAVAACVLLRRLKVKGEEVPMTTEIVLMPKKTFPGQFPALFLFTSEARMMRPVINLDSNQLELIGTLEQVYLDIAVIPEEIIKGKTTHIELSKTAFLSNLAMLVPMPDCNQSPRNMYQCQMGKQTMGTPLHTWSTQAETKLYRLQNPATPLFRPRHHDDIGLDDYPMGTNAIVAVISYTGYDMEDAMIINKSAHERGFGHGFVYKSEFIELKNNTSYFCRDPTNETLSQFIDEDGLPYIGTKMNTGDPLYSYYDGESSRYQVRKFSGKEEVVIDNVRLCGDFNLKLPMKACVVMRIKRNPSVGDKFASRAGQKGICSQNWPAEDLPFTESGLIPDIIFNPHGFPSRMTIAMMIETMAGKSAALHGLVHDATPFRFNEEDTAINHFGRLLEAGGYNYYGTERMYSGTDGREMKADIFFGVIHYQRLRHMVSDKWQVRTTGPIDALTHQPIKGRRRGGGVRFGEMERDGLISHGLSFLLQDRLFHCSDKTRVLICTHCGTLLGPVTIRESNKDTCRFCKDAANIAEVEIPYIFKFFVTQLAAMNINIKINCIGDTEIKEPESLET